MRTLCDCGLLPTRHVSVLIESLQRRENKLNLLQNSAVILWQGCVSSQERPLANLTHTSVRDPIRGLILETGPAS